MSTADTDHDKLLNSIPEGPDKFKYEQDYLLEMSKLWWTWYWRGKGVDKYWHKRWNTIQIKKLVKYETGKYHLYGTMRNRLVRAYPFPDDYMSIEFEGVPLVYLGRVEGVIKHRWGEGIPTPSVMRARLHQMYQKYSQQVDPLFQKLNIPTCITELCVCYVTGEKYN